MKFLSEVYETVSCISEYSQTNNKKNLFIEGVFMQYNNNRFPDPNRNNRRYDEQIIRREVDRYIKESIEPRRAYGELNHPQGPQINLDRVCHLIEKLEVRNDGTVYGKAKILDTPMGNIVKGLLEGGACLGVSTRGLGSIKECGNGIVEVQDDYRLVTAADVVADPSAQRAYVNAIMENADWVFNDKTGEWVAETRKYISKLTMEQIEQQQLKLFENFLKTL